MLAAAGFVGYKYYLNPDETRYDPIPDEATGVGTQSSSGSGDASAASETVGTV